MVDALAVLRRRCGSVPQGDFVRAPDSISIYLCSRHACKCGGIFNNEKGEEIGGHHDNCLNTGFDMFCTSSNSWWLLHTCRSYPVGDICVHGAVYGGYPES